MAIDPAAAPPPATSIYDNYNAQGEGGGTFAPPHIAGWQPSRDAVAAWTKENHPVNAAMIDELRMPAEYGAAPQGGNSIAFGTNQGTVDPAALQSLAQGGKYDVAGRRNAIAARLLANEQAAAAQPVAAPQIGVPDWYRREEEYDRLSRAHMTSSSF